MAINKSDKGELGASWFDANDGEDLCIGVAQAGTRKWGLFANGVPARSVSRATVAGSGTVTAAQVAAGIVSQDASGGNVTMTSPTAALLDAAFGGKLEVGDAIPFFVSGNHATNTSTIAGGTGVTLVGSGAVVNTGGSFLFVKTAATPTFDLVRVG